MNSYETYTDYFRAATGFAPHVWQTTLATAQDPCNRLIRIPTGFGKTSGTVLAWLWQRGMQRNPAWPRRLVFCLPMRVLVEQTEAEVRAWLDKDGLLWDGRPETRAGKIGVHVLMGGTDDGGWHLYPEENAILIGTQDMLLSRALNRGYAAPRARWPMEFGLLNQDALWITDEVQLMDVGLATSAQLQQFREEERASSLRPCFTWWMSATLQPVWLSSVDTRSMVDELETRALTIPPAQRAGPLWDSVTKSVQVIPTAEAPDLARLALERHRALADGPCGRITMIVRNRVDLAIDVYEALLKQGRTRENTRLVHSRFRGAERQTWRQQFLSRAACRCGADLILVATQVVEAGVDISAGCLISDLAPWPSLVQRFGRAARYGGSADIVVLDPAALDEKTALPYRVPELVAAREALVNIRDVSQQKLEEFEAALAAVARQRLYPYEPKHLLLRKEIDELFDTTPDLTGADLDISRFIRSGRERDCHVFWTAWDHETPPAQLQPYRDALCAVPFYDVHKWLFNKEHLKSELKTKVYVWDYLDDAWCEPRHSREIYPGRLLMVHLDVGGYSSETGFTGEKRGKKGTVELVSIPSEATRVAPDTPADSGENNESLSVTAEYQTIAAHGGDVAITMGVLASSLGLSPDLAAVLTAAGRYHDLGKVHSSFRNQITPPPSGESGTPHAPDLAKAPHAAWNGPRARGFRHELGSALALMELLARVEQQHPALLGACRELIEAHGLTPEPTPATPIPQALADELRAFSADQFNLLLYLVCAHHGKVRAALHACPADQETAADDEAGMPIRGIKDGDPLPPVRIMDIKGREQTVAGLDLHLAPAMLGLSGRYGPSWRERALALQAQHGPFALAWLETILRAADIRVSREANA